MTSTKRWKPDAYDKTDVVRFQFTMPGKLLENLQAIAHHHGAFEGRGRNANRVTVRRLLLMIAEGQLLVMDAFEVKLMLKELGFASIAEMRRQPDWKGKLGELRDGDNRYARLARALREGELSDYGQ